jgi:NO-binding membrane sensor protein with MHYT domain
MHGAHDTTTVVLSYVVSVLGSLIGLLCTTRARQAPTAAGAARWVIPGAIAIGGVGIWLMHFTGMLGYAVGDEIKWAIKYDLGVTAISAVVAICVVGVGLFTVVRGRASWLRLVAAGTVTGVGVAAMHYTGMAAMQVRGHTHYDRQVVAISVGIAVVAATAAFWFVVKVRNDWAVVGSAIVMGAAVCGMHYTGMRALTVRLDTLSPPPIGVDVVSFVLPMSVAAGLVFTFLLFAVFGADEDLTRRERVSAGG